VRYDQFRDAFSDSLRAAGLHFNLGSPTETIDLGTTSRRWKAAVGYLTPQRAEPFLVSASVWFDWSPFESARTYTIEEDLVTELLGRDEDPPETMPRHLRTAIVLHATLAYDSRVPMPGRKVWSEWSIIVEEDLTPFLSTEAAGHEGGFVIVMGWRGTVEVQSKCSEEGALCLSGVSLPSWHAVVPPRIRDGVDEEPEGDIERQLQKLAKRYRDAYDAWMDCVTELRDEMDLGPSDR
jgi:hypothetical protein